MSDNMRQGGMSVVDIRIRQEDLDKDTPSTFSGKICTVFMRNNIACWFYPASECSFTLCYPAWQELKVKELLLPFNINLDLSGREEERKKREEAKKKTSWWKRVFFTDLHETD